MNRAATGFPTLRVDRQGLRAEGSFAAAQARYLEPDPSVVAPLRAALERTGAGVVAHFYMDAELQGALVACQHRFLAISDSLVMADRAIEMAQAGARAIVVLGVDFMAENARAMLDLAGLEQVPVLRVSTGPIGCSLAAAAEAPAYRAWLTAAARDPEAVHVVYINTSLRTKAWATALLPTITCTSSNVVRTILQIFAQRPQARVYFGPDTYMGANVATLLETTAELGDPAARALHPAFDAAGLRRARARFEWFQQGNCVVHHMFGAEVVDRIARELSGALITAHLEVPGAMFALALRAAAEGRGVVGSTADILRYVDTQTQVALASSEPRELEVVLGTETGMVTSLVGRIRERLAQSARGDVAVRIVFPVGADAIAATGDASLPIVPGVPAGEGCSTTGGCASCPYMKLNSLDALRDLLDRLAAQGAGAGLAGFAPRSYPERIAGRPVAELGGRSVSLMREFQRTSRVPESLWSQRPACSPT